jgi:hypothetical protein
VAAGDERRRSLMKLKVPLGGGVMREARASDA